MERGYQAMARSLIQCICVFRKTAEQRGSFLSVRREHSRPQVSYRVIFTDVGILLRTAGNRIQWYGGNRVQWYCNWKYLWSDLIWSLVNLTYSLRFHFTDSTIQQISWVFLYHLMKTNSNDTEAQFTDQINEAVLMR